MKRNILCALVYAATFCAPLHLSAQFGAIFGTVRDSTGKPVAGATVKIIGTSPLRGGVSKSGGTYRVAGIRVGTYSVQVSSVGYTSQTRNGIRIEADSEINVDFSLSFDRDRYVDSCIIYEYGAFPGSARSLSEEEYGGVLPGGVGGLAIRGGRAYETTLRDAIYPAPAVISEHSEEMGRSADGQWSEGAIYAPVAENELVSSRDQRFSTFSIDVDPASYSIARGYIGHGALPPKDAVRIEELINYFPYDYPSPRGDDPFSITTDVADCPWNPAHRLVRIGLQGRKLEMAQLPPNNLVFLIDVSGSMQSGAKLPLLKQGLQLLVAELRAEDRVAIVTYAGNAGLVLGSTSGERKSEIIQAIESLQPGGSTAGEAGIALAYDIARKHFDAHGNNRVILCTDGDFNVGVSSREDLTRMIELKRREGIWLTVLGFGGEAHNDATMELLADKGNGSYAYIDGIDEARKVLVRELGATLFTIARDVKIQVEFDPARVVSYRLIGYENRMMAREDFHDDTKDAGELGAGHAVTALYEIVTAGSAGDHGDGSGPELSGLDRAPLRIRPASDRGDTLLFVKLRYKAPADSVSRLLIGPVLDRGQRIGEMSDNFRHAAAVAEFGMLLRDSKWRGSASYDDVIERARGARGADAEGYRDAFIRLVERCRSIAAK